MGEEFDYKDQLKKIGYEKARAESREEMDKLKEKLAKAEDRQERRSSKSRKEKLLSPLELYRKKAADRKELAAFKREKYLASRTAKIGKFISRSVSRPSQNPIYARQRQQVYVRPAPRPQTDFDFIFRAGDFEAPALEREISGTGANSFNLDGDKAARQVGREAFLFGNLSTPTPSKRVNQEANFFSKIIDIDPAMQISREVSAFANILTPRQQTNSRKRRRR